MRAGSRGVLRRSIAALRGADEHFDEVVVHAIVEVALHGPGELRVFDIAGVDGGVVGVESERAVLELDDEFDCAVVLAGGKIEEGVVVAAKFGPHLFQGIHGFMLA